ncbi:alpha/beta hydrolase [Streptomyces sp. NPDC013178]|uniref:alpha/beta hydrolase n=1 Tax=Streptomyces sp. NPDC013178 TaxID=3155118 RepID=UPI0033DC86CA
MTWMTRAGRFVALGGALALALPAASAATEPGVGPHGAARSGQTVLEARYDLGDLAFEAPSAIGYVGRSEVSGTVYYPADLTGERRPIVFVQHGSWATCADKEAGAAFKAAQEARDRAEEQGDEEEAARQQEIMERAGALLWAWPCAQGTERVPSDKGYDYLGRALAARGFVVVSMGTNGINATAGGQADTVYRARAALIEHHALLWQRLARTGGGPLGGALVSARTGERVGAAFRSALDLGRVGLMGHSMGGGGVMQEVSDTQRTSWPDGIRIKAAFALAPTSTWDNEPVTRTPFAVMWGTCDAVNSGEYYEWNSPDNQAPVFKYTLEGGNHAYYNRQWSPSTGQVMSRNDALPGSRPGSCLTQHAGSQPPTDQEQLSEAQQRRVTSNRVTAFFEYFLQGRKDRRPYLTGEKPFPGEPDVTTTLYDAGA